MSVTLSEFVSTVMIPVFKVALNLIGRQGIMYMSPFLPISYWHGLAVAMLLLYFVHLYYVISDNYVNRAPSCGIVSS